MPSENSKEIVSPDRTNSLCIIRFFKSLANICKNMTIISSTSVTYVPTNLAVVLSKWHKMAKHILFIIVL